MQRELIPVYEGVQNWDCEGWSCRAEHLQHPVVQRRSLGGMLRPGGFHGNGKMLSPRRGLVLADVAGDEAVRPEHPKGGIGGDPWGQGAPSPPHSGRQPCGGLAGGFGRRVRVTSCGRNSRGCSVIAAQNPEPGMGRAPPGPRAPAWP